MDAVINDGEVKSNLLSRACCTIMLKLACGIKSSCNLPTALYRTVILYCTVLYCTVLYCTVLLYNTMVYICCVHVNSANSFFLLPDFFQQGMALSARKLIARREYFSLLPLLPVLKYLSCVLIKFAVVLQVCTTKCQSFVHQNVHSQCPSQCPSFTPLP